MGRSQRAKGQRGELQARDPLRILTGREWERSARQSRARGGEGVPDLVLSDGGTHVLHPEVKVGAAPPVLPALEQATADATPGSIPAALVKRDRGEWVLAIRVEDFWPLVAACGGRSPGALSAVERELERWQSGEVSLPRWDLVP